MANLRKNQLAQSWSQFVTWLWRIKKRLQLKIKNSQSYQANFNHFKLSIRASTKPKSQCQLNQHRKNKKLSRKKMNHLISSASLCSASVVQLAVKIKSKMKSLMTCWIVLKQRKQWPLKRILNLRITKQKISQTPKSLPNLYVLSRSSTSSLRLSESARGQEIGTRS